MTRKHFEAFADAMAAVRPTVNDSHDWYMRQQWIRDVQAVAHVLALSNSRFDRERFVNACERR